jgi:hypothetical protein
MVAHAGFVSLDGVISADRRPRSEADARDRASHAACWGLIIGIPGGPLVMGLIMGLIYLIGIPASDQLTTHLLFMSVMLMPFTLLAGAGIFALAFYLVQRSRDARPAPMAAPTLRTENESRGGLFLDHVHLGRWRRR